MDGPLVVDVVLLPLVPVQFGWPSVASRMNFGLQVGAGR